MTIQKNTKIIGNLITLFKMKNNKPDWLKKVEQQAKEFNESKFAKLTDAQFEQHKALKYFDSDAQSQRGKKAHESKLKSGYYQSEKHKNAGKKGGSIVGQQHVESGHIKKLGQKYGGQAFRKIATEDYTCPVCGQNGKNRSNYKRWHGDNCKHTEFYKFFNQLPNTFSRKEAVKICEDNNYPQNFTRMLFYGNYKSLIECIHKGTNGSVDDVPIFKKKGDQ